MTWSLIREIVTVLIGAWFLFGVLMLIFEWDVKWHR